MVTEANLGPPIPVLPDTPSPIFVVGVNGSGTTMLRQSLGYHPQIYSYPRETRVIPEFARRLAAYGDLNVDANFLRLWRDFITKPRSFHADLRTHRPWVPENWQEHKRNLGALIDASFRGLALRDGKERWLEKSPHYMEHMPLLRTLFPNARFIHVVRDGRDVAASNHRRRQRTPELTIYRWRQLVDRAAQSDVGRSSACFNVQYEALTADPDVWMRRICDHIGVPFVQEVLSSRHPGALNKGEEGHIAPNSGKWRGYFDADTCSRLEFIAGRTLASSGYQARNPGGAHDPSPFQQTWWRWRDFLRLMIRTRLVPKLKGTTNASWSLLFSELRERYAEYRTKRF